jgi:hypothetical protein
MSARNNEKKTIALLKRAEEKKCMMGDYSACCRVDYAARRLISFIFPRKTLAEWKGKRDNDGFVVEESRLQDALLAIANEYKKKKSLVSTRRGKAGLEYIAGWVYWGKTIEEETSNVVVLGTVC